MLENAAAENLIQGALLLFLPIFLATSHLGEGWNSKTIKQEDKKSAPIHYQIYAPKKVSKDEKFPIVLLIKERGGRLTEAEVKSIEARAEESNQVFVVAKSQNSEWQKNEVNILEETLRDVAKYRNIDDKNIKVVSHKQGNEVALELLCRPGRVSVNQAVILNHTSPVTDCKPQNKILINNDTNLEFWETNSKSFDKLSVKNLTEFLNT